MQNPLGARFLVRPRLTRCLQNRMISAMKQSVPQRIDHPLPPFVRTDSRLLILGSFPSVKTRETGFFYGHPNNRFWQVLALLLLWDLPVTRDEKTAMLGACRIALWDVIKSCEIKGSADASIRNVVPNPIANLVHDSPIRAVILNGGTAAKLYETHVLPKPTLPYLRLPSTSPANAAYSVGALCEAWQAILPFLQ